MKICMCIRNFSPCSMKNTKSKTLAMTIDCFVAIFSSLLAFKVNHRTTADFDKLNFTQKMDNFPWLKVYTPIDDTKNYKLFSLDLISTELLAMMNFMQHKWNEFPFLAWWEKIAYSITSGYQKECTLSATVHVWAPVENYTTLCCSIVI